MKIDFDLLRQELSKEIVEGPQERYRLDWPGKRESLALANAPITKTLRPCKEESVDFETTKNLYIEGDNLDALKLLQETYLGKVKMIYIDPPYNTGNDFIYDDNFSMSREEYEESSGEKDELGNAMFDEEKWKQNSSARGRFHSEWLSMMYPRLKLARDLLRDNGVIFASIDSGEVANLRKVMDEVFGSLNFIDQLVWNKKVSPSNDSQFFSNDHEVIICYAKSKDKGVIQRQERSEKHNKYYKNPDNDPRGEWNSTAATCNKNSTERPNLYYGITNPNTGEEIWPKKSAVWALSKTKMLELIADNRIYWGSDGLSKSPRIKNFLTEAKKVVPRNVLGYQDFGSTQSAAGELKDLLEGRLLDYPKPSRLLEGLVKFVASEEDFLVLDFFSGSGTTAHAVMKLNAEDGGNRRHIMVQLPEPCDEKSEASEAGYQTIAEIGKERIRRAGKKIQKELESELEGKLPGSDEHEEIKRRLDSLDTGFRVLKIDSSNMAEVYYQPDQITQEGLDLQVDNVKQGREPVDLLFQVLLDWGVDLGLPITEETIEGKKVFFVAENALAACFDTGLTEDFCKALAKREPLRAVFRDAGYASDSTKINIEQIFKALSPQTELKTL